jgi:hypothetical protein
MEIQTQQIDFTQPTEKVVGQFEQLSITETQERSASQGSLAYIAARDEVVNLSNQFMKFVTSLVAKPLKGSQEANWIAATAEGFARLIKYYQNKVDTIERFDLITATGDLAVN